METTITITEAINKIAELEKEVKELRESRDRNFGYYQEEKNKYESLSMAINGIAQLVKKD